MNNLQAELVETIRSYIRTSPLNRLRDLDGSPFWDEPLVGFAVGDDPLFDHYKSVVAPEHQTPREVLSAFSSGVAYGPIAVVSWVLPIAEKTRQSNAQMSDGPSVRWNHTRFQGEECNDSLRRHVVHFLEKKGLVAIAPAISPTFRTLRGPHGLASTWSERHVAHAAGLGTFGLSDGLITAKGMAHRCGSVVVGVEWPASPRPYTDHHAYCLYYSQSACGECIDRCPAGAIGPDGHDKDRCQQHLTVTLAPWRERPGYSSPYLACGLCQAGVPCESCIPAGIDSNLNIL
jgi:hypothetical protein